MDANEHTSYHFRLRHGSWRFENETTGEVLRSGSSREYDGVIPLWEFYDFAAEQGFTFSENEDY